MVDLEISLEAQESELEKFRESLKEKKTCTLVRENQQSLIDVNQSEYNILKEKVDSIKQDLKQTKEDTVTIKESCRKKRQVLSRLIKLKHSGRIKSLYDRLVVDSIEDGQTSKDDRFIPAFYRCYKTLWLPKIYNKRIGSHLLILDGQLIDKSCTMSGGEKKDELPKLEFELSKLEMDANACAKRITYTEK
ncbi:17567_t:CDS:2, partial [Funneliformis caledonium]